MSLHQLNDLYNHGYGSGGGSGIGRHMLMYRSHHGTETSTYPIIILKYYQNIYKGPNFDKITVTRVSDNEVIVGAPELVGDDSIRMVTTNGRPLDYLESYAVSIPDGALYDKRKLPLTGGYHYTFTVDENHSIIYEITEDMDGAAINELIDVVEGNRYKLPYAGEVNLRNTPVKYPDGLVLMGNKCKVTANAGITLFEPQVPGKCKLDISDMRINGTVIGEDLVINNCSIKEVKLSESEYESDTLSIRINRSIINKIDTSNYTGSIAITDSIIEGDVINLHGKTVWVSNSSLSNSKVVAVGDTFKIDGCNLEEVAFDVTNVEHVFDINKCMITTPDVFITRIKSENNTYIESSISIFNSTIASHTEEDKLVVVNGNTLPTIGLWGNIITGMKVLTEYKNSTLDQYDNLDDPMLIIMSNIIDGAKLIESESSVNQYVTINISANDTKTVLEIPSYYFRGIVNSNSVADNKLISRPDLLVRNNLIRGVI